MDTPLTLDAGPLVDVDQLLAARGLMVSAMTKRGYAREDAEDIAQDVVERILRHPQDYMAQLADVDGNAGFFVVVALRTYLMRLRTEKRRRRREERHHRYSFSGPEDDPGPAGQDIMLLADLAPLTSRQRSYLEYVFAERLSIEEIAIRTGTSPRAVRGVLQRATTAIRHHLLHSST
jgi:RNA polymerase sigma factor (sigma-70 family)